MCGRYVQGMDPDELDAVLGVDVRADDLPEPSWNIKPTQQIPVLVEGRKQPGLRRLASARWSLTPSWSKTLETRMPLFNARIETVLEKPSFKAAARNRRCIIPASGYYEWTGEKAARVPHYIHAETPILFAGLASWWRDPTAPGDDGWHLTATILTMDAYGPMQHIHDRIPVFMTSDLEPDWLSPGTVGDEALMAAVAAASKRVGDRLSGHEVAPLRGDSPDLITAS